MKVAILGGSFDPPHVGHMLVAQQVKKLLNIDQVWMMPVFQHPFNKCISSAKDRLAMTKLLEDQHIFTSNFEIQRKTTSFTIDSLHELQNIHPIHTFFWIIGSDQIENFPKWKDWKDIIQTYGLIIYARDESPEVLEEKIKAAFNIPSLPNTIHILTTRELLTSNVSSTEIRQRIQDGLSIRGLVPKKVEQYIQEHKLYT